MRPRYSLDARQGWMFSSLLLAGGSKRQSVNRAGCQESVWVGQLATETFKILYDHWLQQNTKVDENLWFGVRSVKNAWFSLTFLTFLTQKCPKPMFSLTCLTFLTFPGYWKSSTPSPERAGHIWKSQKVKKIKKVNENTGFGHFWVKNVKKVNENTGFSSLMPETHMFSYTFETVLTPSSLFPLPSSPLPSVIHPPPSLLPSLRTPSYSLLSHSSSPGSLFVWAWACMPFVYIYIYIYMSARACQAPVFLGV